LRLEGEKSHDNKQAAHKFQLNSIFTAMLGFSTLLSVARSLPPAFEVDREQPPALRVIDAALV
jgi:hypothetical protein